MAKRGPLGKRLSRLSFFIVERGWAGDGITIVKPANQIAVLAPG